jgi:hypothetical protein
MLLLRQKREGVKTLVLTFEGRSQVSLQLQGTQIDSYLDLSPTSDRGSDSDRAKDVHVARQSESEYCAKSVGVVAAAAALLHLVRKNQELESPRKEVPRVKDYSSGEGMSTEFPVVTWKISVPTEERTWHG